MTDLAVDKTAFIDNWTLTLIAFDTLKKWRDIQANSSTVDRDGPGGHSL
jgi:hypothetical protein